MQLFHVRLLTLVDQRIIHVNEPAEELPAVSPQLSA
jgi:hypothetical protein